MNSAAASWCSAPRFLELAAGFRHHFSGRDSFRPACADFLHARPDLGTPSRLKFGVAKSSTLAMSFSASLIRFSAGQFSTFASIISCAIAVRGVSRNGPVSASRRGARARAEQVLEAVRNSVAIDNPNAAEQVRLTILTTAELPAGDLEIGRRNSKAAPRHAELLLQFAVGGGVVGGHDGLQFEHLARFSSEPAGRVQRIRLAVGADSKELRLPTPDAP